MSSDPSGQRPANYSANINGFRGVCVLLIFLHHVGNSRLPPAADPQIWWQMELHTLFMSFAYGVELFFMISGYVIVQSLRRHATVRAFLQDRVLRIFPVWIPVALALCAASLLTTRVGYDGSDPLRWVGYTVANLLLLPPLLPAPLLHPASWSLTYEWVFYLASALAAVMWRASRTPLAAKFAWGVAVVLLMACYPRALYFLPGVLVALAPEAVRVLQRAPRMAYVALPVFLLSWYATGIVAAGYDIPLWSVLSDMRAIPAAIAMASATVLFVCVAAPDGRGLRVLRSRLAQHLGTISYSFYLVHPLVMAVVKPIVVRLVPDAYGSWLATAAFALVSLPLAWLLSYLSWRWLEQGLARWLRQRTRSPQSARRREVAAGTGHA